MHRYLFLFIYIISAAFICAKTLYVSNTGSDSNTGTYSSPYKTITKAVSSAVGGDTILVRGGVHSYTSTITISKSGTSTLRYYLLAYPNERPILDFTGQSTGGRGIELSGNYWFIKGIDIRLSGDNGMNISGSNNIIEYCAFYENQDSGMQLGGGASNNQVINCDSYWNRDAGEGNADGFSPKLTVGSGNYFYGCRAWQNSDDGWDGYLRPANDITTTLENCWCFANGYRKDGTASTGNGNGFKMGGSDDKTLMHNFVLKNCLAFDNRVKGFDQNNNKGSMTLYNCTGYRNGTNYSISQALNSGKSLTLTNCAALGSYGSLGAFAIQTTNSWLAGFTVTTADFQSVDTAGVRGPRKADGSLPDLPFMHLVAGSDLIDRGTNVGLPYYGTAPDLGAFEYNPSPGTPTLSTTTASSITSVSASSGGTITYDGGSGVTARGVCWNTTGNPTISDSKTTDGSGTGIFVSAVTGLLPSTTYFVRAYATNTVGTAYGGQISFSTLAVPVLPAVTTSAITSITNTAAAGGGNVTNEGNVSVTARGICWNTTGSPTISDSKTADGSGAGTFSSSLTSLTPATTYYVRAYATNSVGTAYGTQISFTTTNSALTIPTLTTTAVSAVTSSSAVSGGSISSDGGAAVTSRGVCWNTTGAPTTADLKTADGAGSGDFTSSITGLTASTMYFVRAYAVNSQGTAYGGEISFTTLSETPGISQDFNASGVWPNSAPTSEVSVNVSGQGTWLLYQAYQVGNTSNICDASVGDLRLLKVASPNTGGYGVTPTLSGVGTISFVEGRGSRTVTIEKSTDNGSSWSLLQAYTTVKCSTVSILVNDAALNRIRFRNATTADMDIDNVSITSYSGSISLPSVTTSAVSAITVSSATGGGNVASEGGAAVTSRGICWNTTGTPTLTDANAQSGSGIGSFSASLTGLNASTLYYVRAYATNSAGTAYGEQVSFTTSAPVTPPAVVTTAATGITNTGATAGGTVTADGGASVTMRGTCWNTSGNPDTASNRTNDGTGTGVFSSALSGLAQGTLYYYRAFAINSAGVAYGAVSNFTTTSQSVTPPIVSTSPAANILTNGAISGGTVSSDGGAAVTARGVCWNTTGTPLVTDSKTSDSLSGTSYGSLLAGLAPATTYYLRSYATNSAGTGYGTELSFSTKSSVAFYNLPGTDVAQVSNWGTNSNGSGDRPFDFSLPNATFTIKNSVAAISSPWTVNGAGSKIVLGDGTTPVSFSIPSGNAVNATIDVAANGNLILQSQTYPAFGTLAPGSTVTFDGAQALTIPALNYSNLASTNDDAASRVLSATGTIAVSGSLTPGTASYTVTGSTISFNGTGTQNIPKFSFNNLQTNNSAGVSTSGNISVGGTLTVNQSITIRNGDTLVLSGASPLNVAASKSVMVNGVLQNSSTGTVTISGMLTVNDGGVYIVNANVTNSYNLPSMTFNTGSLLLILQGAPRLNQSAIGGSVTWMSPGTGTLLGSSLSSLTIGGNFNIANGRVNNGSGGTSRSLTVNGNLNISGGEYDIVGSPGSSSGNQVTTVNGTLAVSGGKLFISSAAAGTGTLNVKGAVLHTGGEFGDSISYTNGTLNFNGALNQTISTLGISNTIQVIINNPAGVTLNSDVSLKGNLTLTSGKVFTNNSNLTLGPTSLLNGTFSATKNIVVTGNGELRKEFSGTGSFVFAVGDTTGIAEYCPLTVSFVSGTFSAAVLGVRVQNMKHPSNNSVMHYLNRYWQISSSGITAFSADVKAAFPAADVAGLRSMQYTGKWDGTRWQKLNTFPVSEDTIRITGVTSFSDFSAGESDYVGGAGQLALKVIPQGYYNTASNRLSMRDTFMVFAASPNFPYTLLDSSRVQLDDSTFIGTPVFRNIPDGNYYVALRGRNIIETWSSSPIQIIKGAFVSYDFTTAAVAAFGSNQILKNGRWCIFSGDLNQDGIVDFSDLSLVDNASLNFLSGYVPADVTGDDFVDFSDLSLVDNNSNNFITVAKPGMSFKSNRSHGVYWGNEK